MRKKKVEMDGESITIGALTVLQVDTFWPQSENGSEQRSGMNSFFDVVCAGINNGNRGVPDFEEWTAERLKNEFDWTFVHKLHDELLSFSGLRATVVDDDPTNNSVVTDGTKKGEAEAASRN